MLTVNPVNYQNTSFKANNDNKACETHSALKTRCVTSAIVGIPTVLGLTLTDTFINLARQSGENVPESGVAFYKANKYLSLATLGVSIAASLGMGILIDHLINEHHQDLANDMKTQSKQDILSNNDTIQTTEKGNLYYHTNTGKKAGTLYGATIALITSTITAFATKLPVKKLTFLAGIPVGALCGLISGSISDYFANRTAKKFADRQAVINKTA